MPIAYMVSADEYDSGTEAVFTEFKAAEQYVSLYPIPNNMKIEDVWLNPHDTIPAGCRRYEVKIDLNGNSTAKHINPSDRCEECAAYGDGRHMIMRCWARDEQHAVQIANERRVQLVASGDWETNHQKWRQRHPLVSSEQIAYQLRKIGANEGEIRFLLGCSFPETAGDIGEWCATNLDDLRRSQ